MPDICAGEMRSILCFAACWIHELAAVQLASALLAVLNLVAQLHQRGPRVIAATVGKMLYAAFTQLGQAGPP
jgi:hypothetical protein